MNPLPPSSIIVLEILGSEGAMTHKDIVKKTRCSPRTIRYALEKTQGEETPHREDEHAGYAADHLPVPVVSITGVRYGGEQGGKLVRTGPEGIFITADREAGGTSGSCGV